MQEWIKKYPWIYIEDPYAEPDEEPSTFLDWIPEGWVKAFGELLCEDLDNAIKKAGLENEFRVIEAKEKYGSLRLFCCPTTQEIDNIVHAYESLSKSVCIHCGSIENIKMVTWSWVSPYCKTCYQKINGDHNLEKFNALPNEEIPTSIKVNRYSKDGHESFEIDIAAIANRVIKKSSRGNENG